MNALVFVTPPATQWNPTVSLASPDTSTVLQAGHLRGLVELRANIADVESFLGFLAGNPAWPTAFTPYRVTVSIRSAKTGRLVMTRVSFQADQLPQTPYIVHYAPGTIEDDNMAECVGPPALKKCAVPTGSAPSHASTRSTGTPEPSQTAHTRSPSTATTSPATAAPGACSSRSRTKTAVSGGVADP